MVGLFGVATTARMNRGLHNIIGGRCESVKLVSVGYVKCNVFKIF